jgi:ATP-dependent DNA helicase RecG
MDLESPVQFVKGVGPQRAEGLAKVGVHTAEDLLLHLPMRYEDRRQFVRVAELRIGMKVAVSGKVAVAGLRRARRLSIYELRLDDGSGRLLKAIFFNQPFLKDVLAVGKRVVLFGLVERDAMASRLLVMRSPQYEIVEQDEHGGVHTGRLVPVYEKLGALTVKPLRRVLA